MLHVAIIKLVLFWKSQHTVFFASPPSERNEVSRRTRRNKMHADNSQYPRLMLERVKLTNRIKDYHVRSIHFSYTSSKFPVLLLT